MPTRSNRGRWRDRTGVLIKCSGWRIKVTRRGRFDFESPVLKPQIVAIPVEGWTSKKRYTRTAMEGWQEGASRGARTGTNQTSRRNTLCCPLPNPAPIDHTLSPASEDNAPTLSVLDPSIRVLTYGFDPPLSVDLVPPPALRIMNLERRVVSEGEPVP
jgi:hypothetical protein